MKEPRRTLLWPVCFGSLRRVYLNMSPYVARKGAVLSLVRDLVVDLTSDGIQVNPVHPGPTETPMQKKESLDPHVARRYLKTAEPSGRHRTTEGYRRNRGIRAFGFGSIRHWCQFDCGWRLPSNGLEGSVKIMAS